MHPLQCRYISALLLSLSTMLHLELPHVNVLSKIDLIRQYGRLGKQMRMIVGSSPCACKLLPMPLELSAVALFACTMRLKRLLHSQLNGALWWALTHNKLNKFMLCETTTYAST